MNLYKGNNNLISYFFFLYCYYFLTIITIPFYYNLKQYNLAPVCYCGLSLARTEKDV